MARIVFCLPAMRGHLGAHAPLARELVRRGHNVTLLGSRALTPLASEEGLNVASLDWTEPSLGGAGLVRTLTATAAATRGVIRHAPSALASLDPDLAITDQAEPGYALAAEASGIPRITLTAGLPIMASDEVPPPFLPWPFDPSVKGRKRNRGGWAVASVLMALQKRALAAGCRDHGLPLRADMADWTHGVPELRQMIPSLDFPQPRPANAVSLGPLRDGDVTETLPPLGDKPLIFASLGTLAGRRRRLLHAICEAAAPLDATLVLAHAGTLSSAEVAALPGRPLVRNLWPQLPLLDRASVCITHGGMNTVLDCVAAGVPMLTLPLAFEQPGIAARVAHHGVGLTLPPRQRGVGMIRATLRELLSDRDFGDKIAAHRAELRALGGVRRGADIIEGSLNRSATGDAA
ncbi:glycosyltransferase (plasmid) [Paracoccus sp. TK19116]|uniref:Glycosyltransferase n=1 Tax=Paracoccus albicereus TaxID=2922394 RepID=A0ABT1MM60_9RHOB|nr:glycosyltransferase [Paracoccus albicereus]MCQ0969362.1 glycosyltransferase [Paracoccus albicereus]